MSHINAIDNSVNAGASQTLLISSGLQEELIETLLLPFKNTIEDSFKIDYKKNTIKENIAFFKKNDIDVLEFSLEQQQVILTSKYTIPCVDVCQTLGIEGFSEFVQLVNLFETQGASLFAG